jgi:hypothetical protein
MPLYLFARFLPHFMYETALFGLTLVCGQCDVHVHVITGTRGSLEQKSASSGIIFRYQTYTQFHLLISIAIGLINNGRQFWPRTRV